MSFMLRKVWHIQFLEEDAKTVLPRKLTFANVEKVRELSVKGGGLRDAESKQAFEHGLSIGRGGMYLALTPQQYAKLKTA